MPDRPSSTDVARLAERLEADAIRVELNYGGAEWEVAVRRLCTFAREAASLLADYEARGEALARVRGDLLLVVSETEANGKPRISIATVGPRADETWDRRAEIVDALSRWAGLARAHTPTDTEET